MAAGANPMAIKRGIEMAVRAVCGYDETQKDGSKKHVKGELEKISKPVEGSMIAQVGAVSANNDSHHWHHHCRSHEEGRQGRRHHGGGIEDHGDRAGSGRGHAV